MALTY